MVLPLAADAMTVLSQSDGANMEAAIGSFIEALEALDSHKEAAVARMVSESAQLRMDQDDEYAAALLADQQAAAARQAEAQDRADDTPANPAVDATQPLHA